MAGLSVVTTCPDGACQACGVQPAPQAENSVTVSLALAAVRENAAQVRQVVERFGHLIQRDPNSARPQTHAITVATRGPGTELKRLLGSLGIEPAPDCTCLALARQMDTWGPAGCREHAAEIADGMRANATRYGWTDRLKAAAGIVLAGLAARVNWLDPFPGLISEAIRRAEAAG